MHREDWDDLLDCSACGDVVSVTTDRVYMLDENSCLCFRCATERGGSFDEDQDRWARSPRLSGEFVLDAHAIQ
jgi:hypothetical protein